MRLGRVAKLTEEEVEAASSEQWEECPTLDERDRAALLWAECVTRNEATEREAARERVERAFSFEERVELTLAIGQFAMLNRINDSLWTDLDDGAPPGAVIWVEPVAFERYAKGMYPSRPAGRTETT